MLMLPVGGLRKTGHAHSYELNCQRPTIPARWGIVSHPSPLPKERELVVGGATAPRLAMVSRGESFDSTGGVGAIAPHPSPLPKERELVVGGATAPTLAMVSRGESFDSTGGVGAIDPSPDRKSTRLNSSHLGISYAL